jgi:hypothetical protein
MPGRAHPTVSAEEERRRAIARLLPLWPHEVEDRSEAGCRRLLARLARALRAERRRGLAGHWTYDLGRHAALLRLYREELAALGSGTTTPTRPSSRSGGSGRNDGDATRGTSPSVGHHIKGGTCADH